MSREELIQHYYDQNVYADIIDPEIRRSAIERLADGVLAGQGAGQMMQRGEVEGEAEGGEVLG